MKIIGCDFHPSYQQIAMLDVASGEEQEVTLEHERGEARRFYEELRGEPVRIGMEASGNSLWFERLMEEMGHELWLGDAARIRSKETRKQKTDRRDAALLLDLLVKGDFPRLWVPTMAMRDTRQLLQHRHKLVQMRTRVKNELQHLALNQGVRLKRKLWSEAGHQVLQALPLAGWSERRRQDLLELLEELNGKIRELNEAAEREAAKYAEVALLRTHPGVGPITALAFLVSIGQVERFARSRQLASYLGLIPSEASSGRRQKFGSITKQGSPFLRMLLVEAGQSAARYDPELKRAYQRLKHKKHSAVAKVMVARKLAVRLYWMWRTQQPYRPARMQGSPSHPVVVTIRPSA
jgi:transposase